MSLIFVDVEAISPSPATGVMTEFGAVDYDSHKTFHGILHDSVPSKDNPAISVLVPDGKVYDEGEVMRDFANWIKQMCGKTHAIFVSDNPAFDWQWVNYYFDANQIKNPFGHSGRRIGDFYAGLTGKWKNAQAWKKLRVTKHDHNPVNDAMGNVEAFEAIVKHYGVLL